MAKPFTLRCQLLKGHLTLAFPIRQHLFIPGKELVSNLVEYINVFAAQVYLFAQIQRKIKKVFLV